MSIYGCRYTAPQIAPVFNKSDFSQTQAVQNRANTIINTTNLNLSGNLSVGDNASIDGSLVVGGPTTLSDLTTNSIANTSTLTTNAITSKTGYILDRTSSNADPEINWSCLDANFKANSINDSLFISYCTKTPSTIPNNSFHLTRYANSAYRQYIEFGPDVNNINMGTALGVPGFTFNTATNKLTIAGALDAGYCTLSGVQTANSVTIGDVLFPSSGTLTVRGQTTLTNLQAADITCGTINSGASRIYSTYVPALGPDMVNLTYLQANYITGLKGTYTPVLTITGGTSPTILTQSFTGSYHQIGTQIFYYISGTANVSSGTGVVNISLPASTSNEIQPSGSAYPQQAGCYFVPVATTTLFFWPKQNSTTGLLGTTETYAVGNTMSFDGTYQIKFSFSGAFILAVM